MPRIVKSLLIGGCGFIGSSLMTKLVQSGRSVTSLDRGVHTHQVSLEHVKYVQGDYSDLHLIEKLVADHDEIIHLAYATVPNTSFEHPLAARIFRRVVLLLFRVSMIMRNCMLIWGICPRSISKTP